MLQIYDYTQQHIRVWPN